MLQFLKQSAASERYYVSLGRKVCKYMDDVNSVNGILYGGDSGVDHYDPLHSTSPRTQRIIKNITLSHHLVNCGYNSTIINLHLIFGFRTVF